jgi:iron complex outermembrane receptor protein
MKMKTPGPSAAGELAIAMRANGDAAVVWGEVSRRSRFAASVRRRTGLPQAIRPSCRSMVSTSPRARRNGFTFKVTDAVTEDPDQYTQDLRLTSPSGGRLDWLAGVFFSREENFRTESFVFPALGSSDGLPSNSISLQSNKGTAYAAYAQASYLLTDALKLTAGLRYSYEKKEITSEARILSGLPLLLRAYPRVAPKKTGWTCRGVSWLTIISLRMRSCMRASPLGFKSGFTGSASTAVVATTPFDPEEATNYEIGAKTELFGRVRLNLAAFHTEYEDTRFFQSVGTTFGQFITENAGEARLEDIEIEISAHPLDALEIVRRTPISMRGTRTSPVCPPR